MAAFKFELDQELEIDQELAGKTVTIRQTKNPFVPKPQYIAYSKVALDDRGWLNMRNLGLEGGDCYLVAMRPGKPFRLGDIYGGFERFVPSCKMREALEGGEGDVITVVRYDDMSDVGEWRRFVLKYERSERRREYWAGIFETIYAPVAQWVGAAAPSCDTNVDQALPDSEAPERDNGTKDSELLEVVSERPNVLYGSGLTHRSRGGTPTTD